MGTLVHISTEGARVIDCVLAGVLGAALLAVILLFQGHRRNRALIAQLQAEITAWAAGPAQAADTTPNRPSSRQRGHLSPVKGCGLALTIASVRRAVSAHRDAFAAGPGATVYLTPYATREPPPQASETIEGSRSEPTAGASTPMPSGTVRAQAGIQAPEQPYERKAVPRPDRNTPAASLSPLAPSVQSNSTEGPEATETRTEPPPAATAPTVETTAEQATPEPAEVTADTSNVPQRHLSVVQ